MAPLPDPVGVAATLQARHALAAPQFATFRWRYYGEDGNFGGEGALRVDPAGRARVDLLGPNSVTVQVAVLIGDTLHLIPADPEVTLPPPSFLWAMAGVFRPPGGVPIRALGDDGRTVLEYPGSDAAGLRFEFDAPGRLRRVLHARGRRLEQDLSLTWADTGGMPVAAEFRDRRAFRRIRLEVLESRVHAPFDSTIFCLRAC